jgi:hypothetical protein
MTDDTNHKIDVIENNLPPQQVYTARNTTVRGLRGRDDLEEDPFGLDD